MIHCTDPKLTMAALDQKLNRSGTGMLLYVLSNYSQPDISNSVHELSKILDSATPSALKELLRIIKFVLNTNVRACGLNPIQIILTNHGSWYASVTVITQVTLILVEAYLVLFCTWEEFRSVGDQGTTKHSFEQHGS